jgi:hypothetical protein
MHSNSWLLQWFEFDSNKFQLNLLNIDLGLEWHKQVLGVKFNREW